jgi:outer membrane biosynthesis protein TonB
LQDQIIVPLDAHTDLYRGSERGEAGTEEVSLQRTDLALFDLDTEAGTITCNLVEVKCYTAVGDIGAYNQLKKSIAEQIRQSEKILQRHFDPSLKSPDRPDRCVKNQELRTLLRFYLERSQRYGIIEWSAADECADFLERLDDGYSLHFRRAGLVFDFDKTGTESPESETGIEYHRIGKDLVQMLLDSCSEARTATEGDLSKAYTASEIDITGVPKLATAEFLAPKRSRTKTKPNVTADSQTEKTQPSETEEEEPPKKPKEEPQPPPAIVYPTNHSIEGSEKDKRKVADLDEKLDPSSPVDSTGNETPETSGSSKTQGELDCEFTLGVTEPSPQFGVLGEWKSRKVALDLNQTHTISLFGVQGGGKSYTLGSVIEMATMPIPHINQLPSPLATVIFHYSSTEDYAPEFTSMVGANAEEEELRILRETYGAEPKSLKDVLILTPKSKVAERKIQFPDVDVESIAFSASELKAAHWKFLMGAVGSQSMYLRQVNMVMRGLRNNLTLDSQRQGIQESSLSDHLKGLAELRLGFAGEYIDDSQILREKVRPGRLIIVDLRDEYIEKDEALGLFVVMLQIFSEATHQGKAFNKLVVFDEAHKYIENEDLVAGLVEVVREMRHKGTSIMVASQDPPSVPLALVELSTQIIMHKFNSPAWLKHIQKVNAALRELTAPKMSSLGTGEAYVWSSKATDDAFTHQAQRIRCRPRVTQHGGATKTAL